MKKSTVLIGVLLLVFGYTLVNIYKDQRKVTRNNKYDKLGAIEISLENSDNKIEPNGYKNGFDFNYNALPVIQIEDSVSSLFFEFEDDNVNEIIISEDYYTNNICYKETYTLNKTTHGNFELAINNRQGKHTTYYIKYNLEDEGVFVFKAEFLFNKV